MSKLGGIAFGALAAAAILGCSVIGWGLGWGLQLNFAEEPAVILMLAIGIPIGVLMADDEDSALLRYVFAAAFVAGFVGGWYVVVVAYWLLVVAVLTSPVWGAWLLVRRRRRLR